MSITVASTPETGLARRLGTLLVGLLFVGVGVALMITAEIGVAPYDVLTTGIAELTGLNIGVAAMLSPLLFTGLGVALGGKAGVGTAAAVLLVGPILGVALRLLPDVEALVPRVVLFVGGFAILACGITAVIIAEMGKGPAEILMLAVNAKGVELARARTAIELTTVAVGWAMGGQVGVGTAVVAVTIGPVLRQLLQWSGYLAPADQAAVCAEPGV